MRLGLAVLALVLAEPAQAATCRGYWQEIQAAIKAPVETLRMVEREAADRMVGLDTRPYDHLLGQARATTAIIADKNGLAEEDALGRCRNYIPPVRHTCAAAAEALVIVLAEQASGAASKASKEAYANVMRDCERFMGLTPLNTALRTSE